MATKQCVVSPCAAPRLPGTARCAAHQHWNERVRKVAPDRSYERHWRRLRQQLLDEWIARYGHTCAGLGRRPPHFASELTVYHPAAGGGRTVESGAKAVCRDCRIQVRRQA